MPMPQGRSYEKIKPDSSIRVDKENRDLFWFYISERDKIRKLKESGAKQPWTDDEILSQNHFTNVFRKYDTGTKRLFRLLRDCAGRKKKVWRIACYRLPNHYAFFEECGFPSRKNFNPKKTRKKLEDFKAGGGQVFTKAHITCQSNFKRTRIENYVVILTKLSKDFDKFYDCIINAESMEGAFRHIVKFYGFGGFTAYEILIDMCYAGVLPMKWLDEFANAGPGCKQGIELIYPSIQISHKYFEAMVKLRDNQNKAFYRIKLVEPEHRLTLQDIEFCLCEYSKYWKSIRGVGKKRKYNSRNEN